MTYYYNQCNKLKKSYCWSYYTVERYRASVNGLVSYENQIEFLISKLLNLVPENIYVYIKEIPDMNYTNWLLYKSSLSAELLWHNNPRIFSNLYVDSNKYIFNINDDDNLNGSFNTLVCENESSIPDDLCSSCKYQYLQYIIFLKNENEFNKNLIGSKTFDYIKNNNVNLCFPFYFCGNQLIGYKKQLKSSYYAFNTQEVFFEFADTNILNKYFVNDNLCTNHNPEEVKCLETFLLDDCPPAEALYPVITTRYGHYRFIDFSSVYVQDNRLAFSIINNI